MDKPLDFITGPLAYAYYINSACYMPGLQFIRTQEMDAFRNR